MSQRFLPTILIPGCLAAIVACTVTPANDDAADASTSDAGGGSSTNDGSAVQPAVGDCVTYSPASLSGSKSGTFASADTVRIPLEKTDRGGGLLKVTYTQDGPVEGSLFLAEGELAADSRTGTGAIGPGIGGSAPVVVTYRLAGNKTYELGIAPFGFDAAKASYKVDYEYQPLIDCYESNDTSATAKRVPVNAEISAYHHAGIGAEDTSRVSETGDDWYFFELTEAKAVRLESVLPGKDGANGGNSAVWSVYAADATTIPQCATEQGSLSTNPVADTESVQTCVGNLAAGKYFVHLSLFTGQSSASGADATFNASWNTPYKLRIVAE